MVRVDWTLVLVWAAVLGLGVVMVASSAMAMSSMFVVRHVVYLLIGLMTCAMVFSWC